MVVAVDVDGNQFIDCSMAIGPISLGYNFDEINSAISSQLNNGIFFRWLTLLK